MNHSLEPFIDVYQKGPVWCEKNLIRNPLALLSRTDFQELLRQSVETGTFLEYAYTDRKTGEHFFFKLKPDVELGYPGTFDKDVLITIHKLVSESGFPPPNPFSLPPLSQICKTMNIGRNGPNVAAIKTSLKRWAGTTIETNSFYLRQQKQYWKPIKTTKGSVFNLWSVHWMGQEVPDGTIAEDLCLFFYPPFYQSLEAFYMQPLDYEFYMSLSPLAKRIYELQAPKFFGRKDSPYTREEYEDYCRRLPIVIQRYYSDARLILDRAHRELTRSKFFSKVEWEGTSYKKPWIIHYYPGARAQAEILEAKGRAGKLTAMQKREQPKQLALMANEQEVKIWVEDIYHKLEASNAHEPIRNVKNLRFYKALASATVRGKLNPDRLRELLSETYQLWNEGRIKKTRSAYFTDLLKRYLAEKGKDLKKLLREA
jgi:hypothetical protein